MLSGCAGVNPTPQLPSSTVAITPCPDDDGDVSNGSQMTWPS